MLELGLPRCATMHTWHSTVDCASVVCKCGCACVHVHVNTCTCTQYSASYVLCSYFYILCEMALVGKVPRV